MVIQNPPEQEWLIPLSAECADVHSDSSEEYEIPYYPCCMCVAFSGMGVAEAVHYFRVAVFCLETLVCVF